jgi:hypothetical protein
MHLIDHILDIPLPNLDPPPSPLPQQQQVQVAVCLSPCCLFCRLLIFTEEARHLDSHSEMARQPLLALHQRRLSPMLRRLPSRGLEVSQHDSRVDTPTHQQVHSLPLLLRGMFYRL